MVMISSEIPRTKNVYPEYYDAVAAQTEPRPFPSPVNDPQWLSGAVDWFAQGENVLEVGPGRGEFAEAVVKKGGPKRYYIADMSQSMLGLVKEKIEKIGPSPEMAYLHADIDFDPLSDIPDASLDRIIMINVFQDVNPHEALRTFRRVIAQKGLLRINAVSRELREEHLSDDENYDRESGHFYLTRSPSEDMKPLGLLPRNDGGAVPYYRILKSYYLQDLHKMFLDSGFEIISTQPVILPRDVWAKTAAAQGRNRDGTTRKYGGHPGSNDIIARPI
jgi:ubiquinone/menaquinone biosynthesis C-methylase UbiE